MNNKSIRKPAVADMFYPGDPDELHRMISAFLNEAKSGEGVPKAIIAPHAGYIYSGPIAASVYAHIAPAQNTISRVILLGPSHRVPFQGIAASSMDAFATPLGTIPLDREAIESILDLPQVRELDPAHTQEHSLEVQLPFLQEVLNDFSLVPLAVGDAAPEEVKEVLEQLWGGQETLIVISSDLSHYHDYATAAAIDKETSNAIEALQPEKIGYDQACGRTPIAGLLLIAKEKGLKAHLIDLRSSGDTAGPRDQVVGYGAYIFE